MKYGIEHQLHPDTQDLVQRFAMALGLKLHRAQEKYHYKAEWKTPGWEADCRRELMRHIEKGDPLDVAAYAAFMWHHGWSTSSNPSRHPVPQPEAGDPLYALRCSGL